MAKIALVSDVHLGTRQYGLSERYEDFLEAFRRFGADVVDAKPDAVVIGGDLFDSPRPDAKAVFCAQQVVGRIKKAGIPVFGIDGNHDLSGGYWLRTVGIEPLRELEAVDIGGTKVSGISYKHGADLVDAVRDMGERGMKVDALVAHFALYEMNGGGTSDTGVQELTPLLEGLGCRFVLMGHVHIPDYRTWNGITYVNPGSTELKSSNEPKDKFWMMVDTETGEVEPRKLQTRPVVEVDIATHDDMLAFIDRLEAAARDRMPGDGAPFYQVVASDDIEDAYARIVRCAHDNFALARVVMRSGPARDVAPVVDRKESLSTLESAIEARFPKESPEARLTASFLHSPEPAAIHLRVEEFMKD